MEAFGEYAKVYDALNFDKNYKMESQEIESLLSKYTDKKDILMLGCGTGKHDRELVQYGYQIMGIDMSHEMIVEAERNKNSDKLSYQVADIRMYKANRKYPIVLSLFHVFSYQNSNDDLLKAIITAKESVDEDGIFIFDAWYGPGVLTDLPSVRIKRVENDEMEIMRIAEPVMHIERNVVDVNYEIKITNKETGINKKIVETHSMRYLFQPEIEYFLELTGLELIECLDCKTLQKPTIDTWTAYFIVRVR